MRWLALSLGAALVIASACASHAKKPDKEERMLDHAIALLQKKDAASICEGAKALGGLGRSEGVAPLLELLKVRDEGARECVKDALGKLDVAPVLLAAWGSSDPTAKDRALDRAAALPHPGLLAIHAEAARDADPKRRRRVATGLRYQGEGEAVMELLAALVADPDSDVRWWAIDTLSLGKGPAAREVLRTRLPAEPDANLQVFIKRALGLE